MHTSHSLEARPSPLWRRDRRALRIAGGVLLALTCLALAGYGPGISEPANAEAVAHEPADAMETMLDQVAQNMAEAILAAAGETAKLRKEQRPARADDVPDARNIDGLPIPLPRTASNIGFDGAAGALAFDSSSNVPALVGFYREVLKQQNWTEKQAPINRTNMAVIDFAKEGQTLSFTFLQMGSYVSADAYGSGLVIRTAAPAAAPVVTGAINVPAASDAAGLVAEDMNGFPVPENHTSTQSGETKYRSERSTTVPAPLKSVLAFYRRELPKNGWKETGGAIETADRATLSLDSGKEQGVLTLSRQDGETAVSFVAKRAAEAKKAGILPKAGKAKLIFGSMAEKPATITIGKRTIQIAPGVGGGARPDGPMLDVAPGKYVYSIAVPGTPTAREEVQVSDGEAWAVVIGPAGGSLPLHMY